MQRDHLGVEAIPRTHPERDLLVVVEHRDLHTWNLGHVS
jgi:hypothetical protein